MFHCILWNCLSFGIESKEFMVWWGNSSMTFRCSNVIRQCGQSSPLVYNVYTDDLSHHLQETGVGCYVGGAWVNSLSYADYMALLEPMITAMLTLLEVCRAYAVPQSIVYNTMKTVWMLVRPCNHRVSTQQEMLGNEELVFVEEFRYLCHVISICWSGSSHLQLLR